MPAVGRIRYGRILLSAAATALAVVLVVLSGCESKPGYPSSLEYPTRTDRLVLRVPTSQPATLGEPGKLDEELAALDSLGGQTFDPGLALSAHRRAIDVYLSETFGSPAAPVVNADGAENLGLTSERLTEGSRLFRRHCLQCHGLTGDGRGPTGQWIYPHPRDFRRGSFKFVSTGDGGKPRRSDLARTLRDGLKGTGMPAFGLLPEAERDVLASYVLFLSLRGQTEFLALRSIHDEDENDPAAFAKERLPRLLREWSNAETLAGVAAPAIPDEEARQSTEHLAAVRRGFELFTAKGTSDCATCHEDFGRKTTYRYDVWGTVVRPAILTEGVFKGGNKPEEVFARIRGGITPSGMPAHPSLSDAQVWDLVWFVRALPYQRELPDDVRAKVYP
jgi:mono/diheme cytochrome c family protein